MTGLTLLRARKPNLLAKCWRPDGEIVPAANAAWFEGKEIPIAILGNIYSVIRLAERLPRVALVKEAVARGADPMRLRRTCNPGTDKHTDEVYRPGLIVVPRSWIVLDVDKLRRPEFIDWREGDALAAYARSMLPEPFRAAACVWQFSGSSGHPSKRNEIRLHLFFMLDKPAVPAAWKPYFAHLEFVDRSIFDQSKIIFTAAPVVLFGSDPLAKRHGLLIGEPFVRVPSIESRPCEVIARKEQEREPPLTRVPKAMTYVASTPLPAAAAAFVEIIARSNILRSRHPAYRSHRSRRLAFCKLLQENFGISEESMLLGAFYAACVGEDDPHGDHDGLQALDWVRSASPTGHSFSARKLLCDASAALHEAGDLEAGARAARLAMVFAKLEKRGAVA